MPNHPHPSAPDEPPGGVMAGMLSLVTDAGKDVVRRITGSDKATAHQRVTRRANAAIAEARGRRRSKSSAARSSRKRSRKKTGKRRSAQKSRARRTTKRRTTRRSARARRR